MLCYVMLCYVMLCYVMLYYIILYYIILYYIILYYIESVLPANLFFIPVTTLITIVHGSDVCYSLMCCISLVFVS